MNEVDWTDPTLVWEIEGSFLTLFIVDLGLTVDTERDSWRFKDEGSYTIVLVTKRGTPGNPPYVPCGTGKLRVGVLRLGWNSSVPVFCVTGQVSPMATGPTVKPSDNRKGGPWMTDTQRRKTFDPLRRTLTPFKPNVTTLSGDGRPWTPSSRSSTPLLPRTNELRRGSVGPEDLKPAVGVDPVNLRITRVEGT